MADLSATDKLLLLLQQPTEPVFKLKKAKGATVYVDVPDEYINERVRGLKPQPSGLDVRGLGSESVNFGENIEPLEVQPLEIPDLSSVKKVPRGRPWSPFYDEHKEAANALVKLMNGYGPDKLFDFCALIRDEVNEQMFVYALMANIVRRKELQVLAPSMNNIFELFPDRVLRSRNLAKVKEASRVAANESDDQEIVVVIDQNFSATDKDPENRLSYFREDLGVNSHHWHWHLIFPDDPSFNRDRRGEMFYYSHHQIVARYDAERLSNGLSLVKSFHRFEEPIPEAYFPKLTTENSGRVWGSRPAGMRLSDMELTEPAENFTISDLETWRDRIRAAIHNGYVRTADGKEKPLDVETGIDVLGNLLEPASTYSVNPRYYGKFHNKGHVVIAHIHDPNGAHREQPGAISDSMTAMRDPVFYRWHKHIDNLFKEYKDTLNPYTTKELGFPGITITEVSVSHENTITTGWGRSRLNLAQGLDLNGKRNVLVELQHLVHEPFIYRFTVTNKTGAKQKVCFRLFISPKFDETGRRFSFREQKNLGIELDKFAMEIPTSGRQFERSSKESTVTVPMDRFYSVYERRTPNTEDNLTTYERFCGCGWPEHLLVPKGTTEGMKFDIFVIATDWSKDEVPLKTAGKPCSRGTAYCGVLDGKYPDKRAMGFPFDRPLESTTTTYEEFSKDLTNVKKQEITIKFRNTILFRVDRSMGLPS